MQRIKKHYFREKKLRQQMIDSLRQAGDKKGISRSDLNSLLSPGQFNITKTDVFRSRSPELKKALAKQSKIEFQVDRAKPGAICQ